MEGSFNIDRVLCEVLSVEKSHGKTWLNSPHWLLYYHPEITAAFIYKGRQIICEPTWLYLVPPHTPCWSQLLMSTQHLMQCFDVTSDGSFHIPAGVYRIPATDSVVSCYQQLLGMDNCEMDSSKSLLYSHYMMSYALTAIDINHNLDTLIDARIEKAIKGINHSFEKSINVSELAEELDMSRENFSRLFKQEVGEPPYQYILKLRINKAKLLLQHSGDSVGDIAETLGFTDQFHFSRTFKKAVGYSPSVYRKLNLN